MPGLNFTSVVTDEASGKKFKLSLEEILAQQPTPTPEPQPESQPDPVATSIPLSWDEARFNRNVTAGSTRVVNGGTIANKSITNTGQVASIVTGNGATIQNCRVRSREGIRIGGSGGFLIDGCYIEVFGTGKDHADGVQAYSPGSKGVIKVRNSLIKCGGEATAGFFIADNWTGYSDAKDPRSKEPTVDLDNVVFQEGPFGLRLHADEGGDIRVALKDVFFVGPFTNDPFFFLDYGGKQCVIQKWENVREATIENGKLILGKLIPQP